MISSVDLVFLLKSLPLECEGPKRWAESSLTLLLETGNQMLCIFHLFPLIFVSCDSMFQRKGASIPNLQRGVSLVVAVVCHKAQCWALFGSLELSFLAYILPAFLFSCDWCGKKRNYSISGNFAYLHVN